MLSIFSFNRTALSEKKPIVKAKSPEKGSKPDDKDPEKSPAKKQEGKSFYNYQQNQ